MYNEHENVADNGLKMPSNMEWIYVSSSIMTHNIE
jgi:hypothetical protein